MAVANGKTPDNSSYGLTANFIIMKVFAGIGFY